MISVTELRAGTIFEDQGNIYQVVSYEHIKMGRGSANIKVKVQNVRTGSTTEKSFINGARVNEVHIQKKDMQFLYKDSDFLYFMDPKTYEQLQVPVQKFLEHQYLKDGEMFPISFLHNEPLSLNLPPKMDFAVTETGPNIKGNSATNIYKDATLENNLQTKVPLFIKTGDRVRIDTRTGEYSEKV
ncbi:MAG: elongation factor P [Candidatus Levybacteria bacterium]|nr:elongation factor P [Candidatus Levybacteria bacterium]